MSQNIDTVRELNAAELDEVGGGLGVGLGLGVDLSQELGAVSGTVDQVGGLAGGSSTRCSVPWAASSAA